RGEILYQKCKRCPPGLQNRAHLCSACPYVAASLLFVPSRCVQGVCYQLTEIMASLSMAPVNIFRQGADEEKAETARLSSFIGAIAIGDLVKSTLGPKGMDKILIGGGREGTVTVTNDGATILKAIGVDNPAAKVLVGEFWCSPVLAVDVTLQ
ncbi:unnamed protein product, partial [Oncorhynchus mykiss]